MRSHMRAAVSILALLLVAAFPLGVPTAPQADAAFEQLAPPGTIWSYNNAGFTIAGRVIEGATGQRIHEALRGLVIEPIGLTRTFTDGVYRGPRQ